MVAAVARPGVLIRLFAALALVLSGLLVTGLGVLAPGPPRINVRWTPQTTDGDRARFEQQLRLMQPRPVAERTWSYVLLDTSRDHVGQILDHLAVEDRHYVGPGRTLTPEAPPLQAWLMARYGRPPANWIAAAWWVAGPLLCAAGLVIAWPQLRAWSVAADVRVAAVVMVSAGLRVWLVLSGGQYFWPDEKRYLGARTLLAAVRGEPGALKDALDEPSSLFFRTVGLVPAEIERLTGPHPHTPALVYGACSLVSIWLVAAIARRLDATRDETFIAALLAASSTALLYWSRHLTGYDLALMCGLFAVFVGVRRTGSAVRSVVTGVWAVTAFLAYAGAWPLAAAVCAIHVADATDIRHGLRRTVFASAGVAAVVAATVTAFRLAGISWIGALSTFSGKVTQGDLAEGWRLPFAYLWHAEHLLVIAWALALAWCGWHMFLTVLVTTRNSQIPMSRPAVRAPQDRLIRAGVVGVLCIYAALAISSSVLHRFVVYGRLSRPLVPFLCLVSAAAVGRLLHRTTDKARRAVLTMFVLAITVQAGFNFRIPLQQEFPAEFIARAQRSTPGPHVFVNARHLYPGPEPVEIKSGYREVASAAHPLEFRPYQYEGYTADERQALRTTDIRMRDFVPAK